jgi:4-alpha-glucanotransferase
MTLPRSCGLLLHPTSLPGPYGVGDLGREAHAFLDYLVEAGQTWWQFLPLGPVGDSYSPYQSSSSFAGNPLLVSPEGLVEEGWLPRAALRRKPRFDHDRADFPAASALRLRWLRKAASGFDRSDDDFRRFRRSEAGWLGDYALFEALHAAYEHRPWWSWPEPLRRRDPVALRRARGKLRAEMEFHEFVQFAFERQWTRLREAAAARGLRLIGDVPIFVSLDSADVWSRPDLFALDEAGRPTGVAGVPPDYFSADGQLWGNPLYDWKAHQAEGFAWWINRLRSNLRRVDLIRLDHFRGFEAYWEVPADAPTAAHGRWRPGPGAAFFEAVRDALGSLPIIAEDLGDITPAVLELRDRFELPGMKVLQFAFGGTSANPYLPHNYPRNCVVYTGTHDNDTTLGWFHAEGPNYALDDATGRAERAHALRYLGTEGNEIHWDLIRAAHASVGDLAIVPLQDVLGLGGEARMNVPGRATGNWLWRCRPEQMHESAPRVRLREVAETYGRLHQPPESASPSRPRRAVSRRRRTPSR